MIRTKIQLAVAEIKDDNFWGSHLKGDLETISNRYDNRFGSL
ncbi:hypothetical protein [Algoriphagus halophilus]|nr:hypothetical protein [Algoriphagus halophilus]